MLQLSLPACVATVRTKYIPLHVLLLATLLATTIQAAGYHYVPVLAQGKEALSFLLCPNISLSPSLSLTHRQNCINKAGFKFKILKTAICCVLGTST